jgi:UDP-glucose:(heptosyl)LPS alpha-1,3-glucosyltransferase
LKEVKIPSIDQRDLARSSAQITRCIESAESAADDDDPLHDNGFRRLSRLDASACASACILSFSGQSGNPARRLVLVKAGLSGYTFPVAVRPSSRTVLRMKIALVRKECSLRRGGAERYCAQLARELMALGHSVTVVGESIDADLQDEIDYLPVEVNNATSWTKNRSFAENAGHVVAAGDFDVSLGLSRAAGLDVYRLTDRLQAHWLHVRYPGRLRRFWEGRLNPRHRAILELERSLCAPDGPRRIITESRLDARLLNQYYDVAPERIRTIYNGVDRSVFHFEMRQERNMVRGSLGLSRDCPVIVYASMDFRGKPLGTVLMALVEAHNPQLRLVVLGAGPVQHYARLAASLGVDDRVKFAGRRDDIQRFYGAGDIFVLPTAYEPFGLVHLEALACGLPVITTATAGGAEVVEPGRNGYVIPDAWAVQELAARLDEYFELSAQQRAAMSAAAAGSAIPFTPQRNARETAEVLAEVCREKGSS